MRKRRVVGRISEMKYNWKGHKDRNRHKNRIKRSGQTRLVYVKDTNRNIPTTWRRARGDCDVGKQGIETEKKTSRTDKHKTCIHQCLASLGKILRCHIYSAGIYYTERRTRSFWPYPGALLDNKHSRFLNNKRAPPIIQFGMRAYQQLQKCALFICSHLPKAQSVMQNSVWFLFDGQITQIRWLQPFQKEEKIQDIFCVLFRT